ncbi:MAG: HNH endonuclease [Acidimicrobiales bacterium]
MSFSEETKRKARARAGGFCECRRKGHGHVLGRCVSPLFLTSVEFHHKTAADRGGGDTLSNCEVLCPSCHRKTDSYGRH